MLLLLDNYDSFTYNLAQYFAELGCELLIRRNDEISVNEIAQLAPDHICISPGPCTPSEAGISSEVVVRFGRTIPILGVCLGHECIGAAYGAQIVPAKQVMHGKPSRIEHHGAGIFSRLPRPFHAGRYHSLVVDRDTVPDSLQVIATSDDGEVMGLQHREFPVHGVQFHPESILTSDGKTLLANFLAITA
ncbi:MAG: anthranilate synthase component II [Chthoniobacterales bacterium]